MPRLAQERWVLALSGALLAVLSLVAPAGYLLLALRYQAGALETEAAALSRAVDGLVSANPDLWRYETIRLEEILQRPLAPGAPRAHRVLDLDGKVVAMNGVEIAPPALHRRAPILDAGVPLGTVEVAWSARPALLGALLLVAILTPAAGGVFLLVRAALRRAAAARDAAEARLRQAQRLEAVGRLAGGVAHDFNNLLAAVMGFARDLRRELPPGSPQLLEDVEEILAVSQRGAQITRSLLAFARQQALGVRRVDAGELLRGLERLLRGTLAPGQTLELELAAEPLPLEADLVQLELVLVNLAANARDAMGPSGHLRIETSAVTLGRGAAPASGAYVRITAHDDGAGMEDGTRQRAFDPFFTTKSVGHGTGLGLAIAHGVVEQHRGVIEVESAIGRGTTFTILLPRAAPGPAPVAAAGLEEREPRRGRDELLLVAEDDRRVRRVLARELRRAGYGVVEAADGDEAVRLAEARRGELALMLLDVAMPGRSGPEVLAQVRRARPETPALFLTGNPRDIGDVPGVEVLLKPVEPEALLRAVRRAIDG
jgi:signal transduction histidine kinase/CheY-like chemotaxis protein